MGGWELSSSTGAFRRLLVAVTFAFFPPPPPVHSLNSSTELQRALTLEQSLPGTRSDGKTFATSCANMEGMFSGAALRYDFFAPCRPYNSLDSGGASLLLWAHRWANDLARRPHLLLAQQCTLFMLWKWGSFRGRILSLALNKLQIRDRLYFNFGKIKFNVKRDATAAATAAAGAPSSRPRANSRLEIDCLSCLECVARFRSPLVELMATTLEIFMRFHGQKMIYAKVVPRCTDTACPMCHRRDLVAVRIGMNYKWNPHRGLEFFCCCCSCCCSISPNTGHMDDNGRKLCPHKGEATFPPSKRNISVKCFLSLLFESNEKKVLLSKCSMYT